MALHGVFSTVAKTLQSVTAAGRGRLLPAAGLAAAGAMTLGIAFAGGAAASTGPAITWGTLDTQPGTAAAEDHAGITMAMFEFSWASFEPRQGVLSASYLATMKTELAAYTAAGQKVTLGLGLENPPAWVFHLTAATYTDQNGAVSADADLVYSAAVRNAAATYLSLVAAKIPLTSFAAIRLGAGTGEGEMLYPGGGTYWAFNHAALTGTGLAPGMTRNPDPTWKPGTPGLTPAQITTWVSWYIGGLDNLTSWEMTTLTGLGFTGTYQTLTPGSGTRPDDLTRTEQANLTNDGTTGVGAVWNLYYAQLPARTRVMAYISSVADNSGGNDSCQPADTTLPLTSATMDSWSATRWITRIAHANGLAAGGENPGLGLPASLDTFYTDTTPAGMMAAALRQARTCALTAFYWAHDIHLHDGTIPLTTYTTAITG
jgi:hypothetical protein